MKAQLLPNYGIILAMLACILLLPACGKQLRIKSNTFADAHVIPQGFPAGSAFSITPLQEDNRFLAKELTQKIGTILTQKGHHVTKTPFAQYHLEFSYDIRTATRTVTVPHYVSGPAQITQGTVCGTGGCMVYQEETQTPGALVYTQEEESYFITSLSIEVYDTQDVEIWQGSASTASDSNDLRDTLDYLLITAFKHFGKNTHKEIYNSVNYSNKEVDRLRKERVSLP